MCTDFNIAVSERFLASACDFSLGLFQECTVAIGGDPVLTSYIDNYPPEVEADRHALRKTDVGAPFPDAMIERHETDFAFLERLCPCGRSSPQMTNKVLTRVIVPGWRQSDGSLWQLNQLVAVRIPFLSPDLELLIAGGTQNLRSGRSEATRPIPARCASTAATIPEASVGPRHLSTELARLFVQFSDAHNHVVLWPRFVDFARIRGYRGARDCPGDLSMFGLAQFCGPRTGVEQSCGGTGRSIAPRQPFSHPAFYQTNSIAHLSESHQNARTLPFWSMSWTPTYSLSRVSTICHCRTVCQQPNWQRCRIRHDGSGARGGALGRLGHGHPGQGAAVRLGSA